MLSSTPVVEVEQSTPCVCVCSDNNVWTKWPVNFSSLDWECWFYWLSLNVIRLFYFLLSMVKSIKSESESESGKCMLLCLYSYLPWATISALYYALLSLLITCSPHLYTIGANKWWWPLACWFILTMSSSKVKVKVRAVTGWQSGRCDLEWGLPSYCSTRRFTADCRKACARARCIGACANDVSSY